MTSFPSCGRSTSLTFDVMPLPRVSSGATIATMSGLCISSESEHTDRAADLLTEVISDEGASTLARTGYVMPANLDVVNGEDFLQTGQRPLHSERVRPARCAIPSCCRPRRAGPLVERVTARALTQLFYEPVILPLQERLEAIDEASVSLFDPSKASPSVGPSPNPSASPSATSLSGARRWLSSR